jgi:hypothetical protein
MKEKSKGSGYQKNFFLYAEPCAFSFKPSALYLLYEWKLNHFCFQQFIAYANENF